MKLFNKILAMGAAAMVTFTACEKLPDQPFYNNGKAPVLASNVTTLAPTAADSLKTQLTFSWNDPGYSTDATNNKYILQIDSAGRNFSKAYTKEVIGDLTTSFLTKDLNNILLGFGFEFNKQYSVEARLVSSYGNNNEQYKSNVVALKLTPYKVPPKVALPTTSRLFIVGSATVLTNPANGGWQNPVPVPVQEFTRIDETTWGGIFNLEGGGEYLILPENGQWTKFAVSNPGTADFWKGGSFGLGLNDNFPGPPTAGLYKIILNFQQGTFTVTPFTQVNGLPDKLVMVGSATPGDWANAAGNTQKFTRLNATKWEITINLTGNGEYLILPEPGSWDKKYGVDDNSIEAAKMGGILKPQGSNFIAPATSGSYKIVVDFINNSYMLTKL